MGSTNAPLPPRNSTRELKMHDCLIEVTRFSDGQSATLWLGGYLGQSATLWLGGYLNNETRINTDGTLDPNMLSYDDFEQDLMDHLGFDAYEENLRWDYKSPFPPRASPGGHPAFLVRSYNTWVAALLAMQHASSAQVNSGVQSTSTASSPIMTVYFDIV
ncbi:hypothetical protein N7501_011026 [Penicillium viridicatum]|nr:hypothetical protein N7501_011026 [Penicillium viridicatum]